MSASVKECISGHYRGHFWSQGDTFGDCGKIYPPGEFMVEWGHLWPLGGTSGNRGHVLPLGNTSGHRDNADRGLLSPTKSEALSVVSEDQSMFENSYQHHHQEPPKPIVVSSVSPHSSASLQSVIPKPRQSPSPQDLAAPPQWNQCRQQEIRMKQEPDHVAHGHDAGTIGRVVEAESPLDCSVSKRQQPHGAMSEASQAAPPYPCPPYPGSESDRARSPPPNVTTNEKRVIVPADPNTWSTDHVQQWVQWTVSEYSLQEVMVNRFDIDGKQLCKMTRDDFTRLTSSYNADVLLSHLNFLRQAPLPNLTSDDVDKALQPSPRAPPSSQATNIGSAQPITEKKYVTCNASNYYPEQVQKGSGTAFPYPVSTHVDTNSRMQRTGGFITTPTAAASISVCLSFNVRLPVRSDRSWAISPGRGLVKSGNVEESRKGRKLVVELIAEKSLPSSISDVLRATSPLAWLSDARACWGEPGTPAIILLSLQDACAAHPRSSIIQT
ncbi:transcriptional regulator Erg-like [Asterias rubens]|uniref:transcriptional regulator Erg-like n=1 Tax=Asterias rubens TaxID=7604 RepID=UPI00145589FD|nr:transcriptional regulator Erg-like [Asterias rubens]